MGRKDLYRDAVRSTDLFEQARRENPVIAQTGARLGSRLVVAKNVLRLRVQRGMTQRELARALSVTQPRIAEIEGGRADLRVGTIDRLAEVFGVEPGALLRTQAADAPRARATTQEGVRSRTERASPARKDG